MLCGEVYVRDIYREKTARLGEGRLALYQACSLAGNHMKQGPKAGWLFGGVLHLGAEMTMLYC